MNGGGCFTIEAIAAICHAVNAELCRQIGDDSQVPWADAPEWQKQSARNGVQFNIDHPDWGPHMSHLNWMDLKREEGWIYGPVKDPEKKEHPCMVPYEQLPVEQRAKDHAFKAVVSALSQFRPKS